MLNSLLFKTLRMLHYLWYIIFQRDWLYPSGPKIVSFPLEKRFPIEASSIKEYEKMLPRYFVWKITF